MNYLMADFAIFRSCLCKMKNKESQPMPSDGYGFTIQYLLLQILRFINRLIWHICILLRIPEIMITIDERLRDLLSIFVGVHKETNERYSLPNSFDQYFEILPPHLFEENSHPGIFLYFQFCALNFMIHLICYESSRTKSIQAIMGAPLSKLVFEIVL
jgi:hypothetical protein